MSLTKPSTGDVVEATHVSDIVNHLEGAVNTSLAWKFNSTSGSNHSVQLGDNAGVRKFSVIDSDGVEVASIDSDGNLTATNFGVTEPLEPSGGDDATQIQAAHDALPANGGTIVLDEGSFSASELSFTKPTRLRGAGRTSTRLAYTGTGTFITRGAEATLTHFQGLEILDMMLSIDNQNSDVTLVEINAGNSHCNFDRVVFTTTTALGTGVHTAVRFVPDATIGIFYTHFERCLFRNLAQGVVFEDADKDTNELKFIDCTWGAVGRPIVDRQSASAIRLLGCDLENFTGTAVYSDGIGWTIRDTRFEVGSAFDTPVAASGDTSTVNTGTDIITIASHGLTDGDLVIVESSDTAPAPLDVGEDYYVVGVAGNDFQLSLTSGGAAIDITDIGVGTHTYRKQTKTPYLFGRNSEHIYLSGNLYIPYSGDNKGVLAGIRSHDLDAQDGRGVLRLKPNTTGSTAGIVQALTGQSGDLWRFNNSSGTTKVTIDKDGDALFAGEVHMSALPTSDPTVAGQLWSDLGIVTVSAG